MKRRWFIRICFMLPILLCVGGWVWSISHGIRAAYWLGQQSCFLETQWGVVYVGGEVANSDSDGWERNAWACLPCLLKYNERGGGRGILGFGGVDSRFYTSMAAPYWFLILLFSALLFFVWRRTRLKINPQTAFPVEIGKPHV